ncbi:MULTISPECIES: LCP family protein [Micromonospora]|uniref:LytR family transcriptional regulator n=1 Tax=Micromonospora solifontis TaxID=2487138 RepID=A0ABX9WK94_9ACTN|nr:MULTISPECIES: LCP family protein [Micromonospora]NES14456.1 LytR family transcriptional regulator [Micromonospora sp. PPF5-17B]NES36755.1 LytR family transcriptional regulator [Micromonospora solifontis]NES56387.1 LytR family transcriptional regulator [Micromonospora sp. PPF5-6]RNL99088.1 LytR family transcriptional regulator [Micromonospora solifontis]
MIEDDLRAAFARHEALTPPTGPLRAAIDRTVVRRRRRRLRLRLGGTALALVAATLGGFTTLAPRPPVPSGQVGASASPTPTGALNMLLLGLDAAGGGRRADSVLLVHVPADRSRLYLVSFPRDLVVAIPGRGRDKLNASFTFGAGPAGDLAAGYRVTRQVVTQLTGVRIDAGAVLTYPTTRKLTDAVGGVPVCLPVTVRSVHSGRRFPAGCQQLDGAAAVDLLRQRYGLRDGGLDRDRNAGRYAAGLLRRVRDEGVLTDPVRLSRLLAQVGPGLVTDTGEMSLPALVSVAGKAATAEPVAVGLPVRFEDWGPHGFELDAALVASFLAALREDRLGEWTTAHPDQVTSLR